MSELKELSWAIQETVEPLPFEALERRGVLRRRRRRVVAAAGAAAVAVLVAVLPFGSDVGTEKPPAATVPTAPGMTLPPADGQAEAVVGAKDAQVRSVELVTPQRWAATWASCLTDPCKYTAVLSRDGVRALAPMRRTQYATMRAGDETIAVTGPAGTDFEQNTLSWRDAMLFRLTADGLSEEVLNWAKPSATFTDDEILTDQIGSTGQVLVLNLEDRTLRKLQLDGTVHSPVRDGTGRWWLVKGEGGDAPDSWIAWTDDGGKTWDQSLLDPDHAPTRIAVSQNGRTVVAFSDGGALKLSTDRGASWRTVSDKPVGLTGGPVAFDDGTALLLGQRPDISGLSLYTLDADGTEQLDGRPDRVEDLAGHGDLVYGIRTGRATNVAISTDRGRSWYTLELR